MESRIEVLSEEANKKFIDNYAKRSIRNRPIQAHWDNLVFVPLLLMNPNSWSSTTPNDWFYIGTFITIVCILYFILYGIVR